MDNTNLAHTLQRYRRLVEVTQDLTSTLDLDKLLGRLLQAALEISSAAQGFILLQDRRSLNLTFYPASSHALQDRHDLAAGLEQTAALAAASRSPVTATAPVQTPDHPDDDYTKYLVLAVPMVSRNRLVGVLEVMKKQGEEFSTDDQELMIVLAADAAIAIENAYLFRQTDLITDLVHELRTPLASLNTISALLQRPEISVEQRLEFARTIHNETQRLNELAANFLDLALLESGRTHFKRVCFDPLQMLLECCQVIEPGAVESGIEVVRNMPDALPAIFGDRDKVKQVFFNLFSNAIKYNQPGGKIYIHAQADLEHVIFEIIDTGVGIPDESMPHLFEKFYRASSSVTGAGLGLSISKRIVESHGGRIEAQSQFGKGTTFRVYLPR